MSKKLIAFNLFGATLLVGGLVALVFIIRERAVNIVSTPLAPRQVVASNTVVPTLAVPQGVVSGDPARIRVPSLDIDVSIIPGYYDEKTGEWTLTKNKAQFATTTVKPNNLSGNTFLYGHARSNIFGALPKIKPGAVAIVTTSNGHRFYYTLSSTRVVDPTDADSVFNYQGKPILTLQTCVGMLYQSRELLTFNLNQVV